MSKRADQLALGLLLAAAVGFLARMVFLVGPEGTRAVLNYDLHTFDIPNLIYLADRILHHGGRGLLWNPFQNSGQPFLGLGTSGALFPPAPLVLLLGADNTLRALFLYAMTVGGVGAFYLARRLGMSTTAAVCGGLAFAFSNAGIDIVTSGANVSVPFAMMPATLWCVEGILVAPTWRRSGLLALFVGMALIGHPQFPFFLGQLVLLRVVWEMLSRRQLLDYRVFGALAVGFALAPLLAAVHVLPVLETMGASIHASALTAAELDPLAVGWKGVRINFAERNEIFNPFTFVPLMLASAALWGDRRRVALFYVLATLLFFDLGLGSDGHLFWYYTKLPGGRLFHFPARFLLMTALPVSVLTAAGVEAILTTGGGGRASLRRWLMPGGMVAVAAGLAALFGPDFRPHELAAMATVLLATIVVLQRPTLRTAAGVALVTALVVELVLLRPLPLRRLLPNSDPLFAESAAFRFLRDRMTSQDRIYLVPQHFNFSFERKTPSLFGVSALDDYNPVVSQRYAEFFTVLRIGRPMQSLHDSIYPLEGYTPPTMARRLLDVAAARYVVTMAATDATSVIQNPPLVPVANIGSVRVYENPSALPRARWVPQVMVVANDKKMLRRLAGPAMVGLGGKPAPGGPSLGRGRRPHPRGLFGQAPRTSRDVALIEQALPSGFLGKRSEGSAATVTFVRDDPEDVVVTVDAPERGFLVLADQYAPGWRATVNGVEAPIVRADYAFRLVEVPAGRTMVAFHYRPLSIFVGAVVSVLAAVLVLLLMLRLDRVKRGALS